MPQPIYRYGAAGEEVNDGALFAFVQATDPELLLVVETHRAKAGEEWHYGLARMTDQALEVRFDDRPVWSVDSWDWRTRSAKQPYIKFTGTVRK